MLHTEFFKLPGEFVAKANPSGWTIENDGNKLGSVRREVRIFGTLEGVAIECKKNGVDEFRVVQ